MLRIHTLGGLTVRLNGAPLAGAAAQPRRMALLALLARAGARGVTRERALALLWPDADADRGARALSQALYALRRDLGTDDALPGLKELRLNPAHVGTDLADWTAARDRDALETAAALYAGPFLDGFHVAGASEFERWVDEERGVLAQEHATLLERLARRDAAAGATEQAVGWWQRLAAADPLNARVAMGLMEAMTAGGDRAGAIRHARIHEALLAQSLDLPPDRAVVALADRLRREHERTAAVPTPVDPTPVHPTPVEPTPDEPTAAAATPATAAPVVPPAPAQARGRRAMGRRRTALRVAALAAVVAVLAGAAARFVHRPAAPDPAASASVPVVAVGRIAVARIGVDGGAPVAPVGDLLAVGLARAAGLRVVSGARMAELLRQMGDGRDSSAGAFAAAARRAGATVLVDGTLYTLPGGRLRLDLRRTDLASGESRGSETVQGSDLFAVVDSGTARVLVPLGRAMPAGSVADVTTHSLVAYRLYADGLARYHTMEPDAAARLFAEALREDSTFALAAYYLSRTAPGAVGAAAMETALRLSAGATDRERLIIRAGSADRSSSPVLGAIADTLVARYPEEIEGYVYQGSARVSAQEFLAAIPPLRHAVDMDSDAVSGHRLWCGGCEALQHLVFAYSALDSLPAAEREARRATRLWPRAVTPWLMLGDVLDAEDRPDDALRAIQRAAAADPAGRDTPMHALIRHHIRIGEYAAADGLLAAELERSGPGNPWGAEWYRALSLRQQGRMADALRAARRERARQIAGGLVRPGAPPDAERALEAQILMEAGRPRESAALYDSIAAWQPAGVAATAVARNRAWSLTHAADALAAAGDTTTLAARIPIIRDVGARSFQGRDHRLYHHVTGLLLAARGQHAMAAAEFRAAIGTPTLGYTRSNVALATALLRLGRAGEAVAALQPALRGSIEGSNLYVSRTALHAQLADAWRAAGRPDSAAAHERLVAADWANGDPSFAARSAAVRSGGAAGGRAVAGRFTTGGSSTP